MKLSVVMFFFLLTLNSLQFYPFFRFIYAVCYAFMYLPSFIIFVIFVASVYKVYLMSKIRLFHDKRFQFLWLLCIIKCIWCQRFDLFMISVGWFCITWDSRLWKFDESLWFWANYCYIFELVEIWISINDLSVQC